MPAQRNFGLDLFRAAAILLVIVAHLGVWAIDEMAPRMYWLHRLAWFSQITGTLGVELFFVLSGFLVGGLALKRRTSLLHFYMRRWLRTIPAYVVMLLLLRITKPWPDDVWRYFLFMQPTINDFFSVSWSLCIEEWFYLILPIFLLLPRRYFLLSVIVVMIALCLARYFSGVEYEQMHRLAFLRLDALLMGVTLAWIKIGKPTFYKRLHHPLILLALAIITIEIMAFAAVMRFTGVYIPFFRSQAFFALFFTFMPMLLTLLLPFAEKCPSLPFKKIITTISTAAYSLYLLHQEIFMLVRQTSLKTTLIGWIVGVLLACVAAFVLYQVVEKPCMRYRDKKWSGRS